MSDNFIRLSVSRHKFGQWVHDAVNGTMTSFDNAADACEYFVRLLIVTGAEPKFYVGTNSRKHFRTWLNKQPNKAELIKLLNMQELVR